MNWSPIAALRPRSASPAPRGILGAGPVLGALGSPRGIQAEAASKVRLTAAGSLALAVLAAGPAQAQIPPIGVVNPIIRLGPLELSDARINIADVAAQRKVFLEWSATVGFQEPYEYQLTYDRDVLGANTPTSTTAPPVKLDPADVTFESGTVTTGLTYRFPITVDRIVPTADLPGATNARNVRRSLFVSVFARSRQTDPNRFGVASASWTFEYDTKPPLAPTLGTAPEVGDARVQLAWTTSETITDVDVWEVLWDPDPAAGTSTSSYSAEDFPQATTVSFSQLSYGVTGGLENGRSAIFAVRGVDAFGNRGPLSAVVRATPVSVDDFFKLYRGAGGEETGGFCFVATAAHGSVTHPVVGALRVFRDAVLETTGLGGAATWAYYHASPPAAFAIASDDALRAEARALVGLLSLGVALLLAAALYGAARGLVRVVHGRAARVGAMVTVLLLVLAARAEARPTREPGTGAFGVGFELKGGPYLPAMAEDSATAPGFDRFRLVYGDSGGSVSERPLYRLGLDLQLFRGFGTAGIGGSFGLMQFVGKGYFAADNRRSSDTNVFNLAPLELTAFYRFDVLADRYNIPLVPYLRGGLAYDLWWVTVGNGDISRVTAANAGDDLVGRGGKLGLTATAGMAIMLNFIDTGSARNLYQSLGIRASYIFAEVTVRKVDGFGQPGFDFSGRTWSVGLYFER